MPRKLPVQYIQNDEPEFIRKFKKRAGIPTATENIDSKHERLRVETKDGDRLDEQPQFVLDPESGISESEAKAFLNDRIIEDQRNNTTNPTQLDVPNRIMFVNAAERKTKNPEAKKNQDDERGRERSPLRSKSNRKESQLLSFNVDGEEDE